MSITIRNAFLPLLLLLSSFPTAAISSQAAANQTVDHPAKPEVPRTVQTKPQANRTTGLADDGVQGAGGALQDSIWQYYVDRIQLDTGVIGGVFQGYFTVLADSNSITFDYSVDTITGVWSRSPLSLPPTIHNGIAVIVPSGRYIKSVTIDPATNMVGFDASRISFKGGQIEVDWENLPFSPSTIVKLDVD